MVPSTCLSKKFRWSKRKDHHLQHEALVPKTPIYFYYYFRRSNQTISGLSFQHLCVMTSDSFLLLCVLVRISSGVIHCGDYQTQCCNNVGSRHFPSTDRTLALNVFIKFSGNRNTGYVSHIYTAPVFQPM